MPRSGFPRTFEGFRKQFAGEEDCWLYLVESRWPEGFRCPACSSGEVWTLPRRALFECRSCRRQTSVTAGTILHRTRLPLSLWFAAADHPHARFLGFAIAAPTRPDQIRDRLRPAAQTAASDAAART